MHPDQLHVDIDTAHALLREQFGKWAGDELVAVASVGTVNQLVRLGSSLVLRFPLLPDDPDAALGRLNADSLAMEEFADAAQVPAPRTVAIGQPGCGYPMPWSVLTWLPGTDGTVTGAAGSAVLAEDLARLIGRLRAADVGGRMFDGAGRGGHLTDHDEWVALCLRRGVGLVDVPALHELWARLRLLPEVDAHVMSHRDLTPPNVLIARGRLAGVLDTGDFGPADPALDLVAAWHLLEAGPREVLRRRLGCGDVQWQRGMAWALQQALGLVWYYRESNPVMSRWGEATLTRLLRAGG